MHQPQDPKQQLPLCIDEEFEGVPASNSKGTRPFILRKGKNILKLLGKHDAFRTEVRNGVSSFKSNLVDGKPEQLQVACCNGLAARVRSEMFSFVPGETDCLRGMSP